MPVRAADDVLPSVLGVPVVSGRWLNASDTKLHTASVVLGEGIAKQYGYLPGESRTISLNGTNFGVVGVLGSVPLDPELDNAAFVTQWAAQNVFHTNGQPTSSTSGPSRTPPRPRPTVIPTAINLGGPAQSSTQIPSDVLQAQAQANKTLQQVALLAGLLALTVGGHRHRQRHVDLGHPALARDRHPPGRRPQPVEDRRPVPPRVALRRACSAGWSAPSWAWSSSTRCPRSPGWVVVIDYAQIPIWMGLALLVSITAGLYPSIKAARLEPLETLRLG